MQICMKCQNLFSGENKKKVINLLSAELGERVEKVKAIPQMPETYSVLSA